MQHLAQLVPSLVKGKKVIALITDDEIGIYQVKLLT